MTFPHFLVAVVGAGPAGASCANSLLINEAKSVALIDKAHFPRDKSCGDGIGPGAVHVLNQLGLGQKLSSHVPIRYLSVSGPSGVRAKGPLPHVGTSVPVGYTIPRLTFDNYIAQSALDRGATDYTGKRLEEAAFEAGRWHLGLRDSDTDELIQITADILVGADGARSKVRRLLRVPRNSDRHTGTAVRIYAHSSKTEFDALQIDFVRELLPAYGWVFPIDRTRANIGVGIDLDNYKTRHRHLSKILQLYQHRLGTQIKYDEGTRLAYILPYGSQLPRLSYPSLNAALIGDAGSMINPLTGEGIFYGMFAGAILGRSLAECYASKTYPVSIRSALSEFERRFVYRFKRHFEINWEMKEKIEIPAWCDMVVNACRRDNRVLSDVIEMMMGDKRDIELGTILRIIARNLVPFLP